MLQFSREPNKIISFDNISIPVFLDTGIQNNTDKATVKSFGNEWKKFSKFSPNEIIKIGNEYFDIINEQILNKNHVALDLGCGTGRWAMYLSDKVQFIEAVDPSESVFSAAQLLKNHDNVRVTMTDIDNLPFSNESFDFVMALGVLHHIPNTNEALRKLVKKIKINGHILLYIYYNLENRGNFYKSLFKVSVLLKKIISKLPTSVKQIVCEIIAYTIYIPFVNFAKLVRFLFKNDFYKKLPLSYYVNKSIWIIRNDALDRFGTPVEKRFSKEQIQTMMTESGLDNINFSPEHPYWHVTGKRIK